MEHNYQFQLSNIINLLLKIINFGGCLVCSVVTPYMTRFVSLLFVFGALVEYAFVNQHDDAGNAIYDEVRWFVVCLFIFIWIISCFSGLFTKG